jgi:uncharacterized membrane protein YfcA
MTIETEFVVLVVGSFLAAVCNAAFSAGGALITLAATSTVLPISAVVPIHSALLFGSTTMRAILFRDYIQWRIAGPFLVGSVFGAFLGARLFFELDDRLVATAIAFLMLVAIWLPQVRWRPKLRQPWLLTGFAHTLLSTLFAYGAIFQGVILHTGLDRRQVIGTVGGALAGMGLFKISGYVLNGFDYTPYLAVIAVAILLSFVGTWLGKRLVDRMSERFFRLAFRALVTLTALRLVYVNLLQ